MKRISIIIVAFTLFSCSSDSVERLAFKKILEFTLLDLCGEEDKKCIQTVKEQLDPCMEKQDFRQFRNNDASDERMDLSIKKLTNCIVDEDGDPLFES